MSRAWRDVRTAVVAAAAAGVVMVSPVGAAIVANADRVDGRHSVGVGATKSARAGKLVATGPAGYLPNDVIRTAPNADRLDGLDSTRVRVQRASSVNEYDFDLNPIPAYLGAVTLTAPSVGTIRVEGHLMTHVLHMKAFNHDSWYTASISTAPKVHSTAPGQAHYWLSAGSSDVSVRQGAVAVAEFRVKEPGTYTYYLVASGVGSTVQRSLLLATFFPG